MHCQRARVHFLRCINNERDPQTVCSTLPRSVVLSNSDRELDTLMRRATELEAELSRRLETPLMRQQRHSSEVAYPTDAISTGGLVRSTVSSELIAFMRQLSTLWPTISFRPPRFVVKQGMVEKSPFFPTDSVRNRLSDTKASALRDEGKPAILRQLAKHWVEVVQPEFPLLTTQQIVSLEDSDAQSLPPTETSITAGLYSVSAALLARDCGPEFGRLEAFYYQQLEDHIQNQGPVEDPQLQRQEITVYLFKVLHHLVKPNQRNLNLHAFISLISQRYKQYFGSKMAPSNLQKEADQVAICLYILERLVGCKRFLCVTLTLI